MSIAATTDVMQTLRDRTMDRHKAAEQHPFQHALATGKLPSVSYAAYTAQLMLVHRGLYVALTRCASFPELAAVVRDHHEHAPRCERDVRHFGLVPEDAVPTSGTASFLAAIEQTEASEPLALLGALYVLEGSTNGGKFIARMVRRAYRLDGVVGTESLDPYGDSQPQRWEEFKQSMRGVGFSQPQVESMVAMACRTFDAVAEIGGDVLRAQPAAAV